MIAVLTFVAGVAVIGAAIYLIMHWRRVGLGENLVECRVLLCEVEKRFG